MFRYSQINSSYYSTHPQGTIVSVVAQLREFLMAESDENIPIFGC